MQEGLEITDCPPVCSVANSLEYAHSPAGDLPRKPGSRDQMLIALIDNEWSF